MDPRDVITKDITKIDIMDRFSFKERERRRKAYLEDKRRSDPIKGLRSKREYINWLSGVYPDATSKMKEDWRKSSKRRLHMMRDSIIRRGNTHKSVKNKKKRPKSLNGIESKPSYFIQGNESSSIGGGPQ